MYKWKHRRVHDGETLRKGSGHGAASIEPRKLALRERLLYVTTKLGRRWPGGVPNHDQISRKGILQIRRHLTRVEGVSNSQVQLDGGLPTISMRDEQLLADMHRQLRAPTTPASASQNRVTTFRSPHGMVSLGGSPRNPPIVG